MIKYLRTAGVKAKLINVEKWPAAQAVLDRYQAKIDMKNAYGRPVRDREADKLERIRYANEFLLQVKQALS